MNDNPDISDEMLVKLAGERAFTLGKSYFEQALIDGLKTRGKATTATVNGSTSGKVRLHYTLKGLEGSCDCPVSDGIDFCEHCVATALSLRALKSQPGLKKCAKPAEVLTTYFDRQNKDNLVSTLVELINKDKSLRQEWLLKADLALGRLDKSTLRKRITSAIPYKAAIHRYHRVRMYFGDIETALETLRQPIQLLPADQQLELLQYAFERLNKATDTVDDSGGFRYSTLELLQGMYHSALSHLEWSDDKKAEFLIQLMMTDEYGFYGEIPDQYVSAISPECLELFYKKVQEKWDALPKWKGGQWGIGRHYGALLRILEAEPLKTDDYARLIELHSKVAVSEYNFLQLAEWSIALQDYDRAQQFIKKARANSRTPDNHRIEKLQQEILLVTGHSEEALEKQWQTFLQYSDLEEYLELKAMAERSGDKRDWFSMAREHLDQQIAKQQSSYIRQSAINTLGWILLEEREMEALWTLINEDKADPELLYQFGQQSVDNPERVFLVFQRLVELLVGLGKNESYQEAVDLLEEMHALLLDELYKAKFLEYLYKLRSKFRAKRNFISLLNETFP
ncbi:MAG: SWIM zinc finger family protein [Endozoicomonas sp.]